MLVLLVLGYIPGTHLQITFNWVLFLIAGILLLYEINTLMKRRVYRMRIRDTQTERTEHYTKNLSLQA